ncbi:MAG: hypothetical protein ACI8U4_000295 [Natronomonas sp.]|jgi:hypothetical protein
MRDRSLDEFASDDEAAADEREDGDDDDATDGTGTDSAAAATDGSDASDGTADTADAPSPEPALSTYEWTPEGAACEDCGTVVEKRWRSGDGSGETLVCADCKVW